MYFKSMKIQNDRQDGKHCYICKEFRFKPLKVVTR